MCKKLIVLCVVLVVVGLSMPALAGDTPAPIDKQHPLKVDIDGENTVTPQANWQSWLIARDWGAQVTGSFPVVCGLPPWYNASVSLSATRKGQPTPSGGSRNRSGGLAFVPGTGEYSAAGKGYGTNYLELKIDNVEPYTTFELKIYGFEQWQVWSTAADNNHSKYGVWSTVNPLVWLNANGYSGNGGEPNGYGALAPQYWPNGHQIAECDTNMPAAMIAAMELGNNDWDRAFLQSPSDTSGYPNWVLGDSHGCRLTVVSDADGVVTVYGWIDPTDWTGSAHIPINGFMLVPEPATVALLGLGGLALLRRKRA